LSILLKQTFSPEEEIGLDKVMMKRKQTEVFFGKSRASWLVRRARHGLISTLVYMGVYLGADV
jgi:hypothetical protein